MSRSPYFITQGTAWYRWLSREAAKNIHSLQGSGTQPYIMCHATGLCGGLWVPFLSHLERALPSHARNIEALVPDFRSHGYTERYRDEATWSAFCPEDIRRSVFGLFEASTSGEGRVIDHNASISDEPRYIATTDAPSLSLAGGTSLTRAYLHLQALQTGHRGLGGGVIGIGHSMGGAALVFTEVDMPGTFSELYLYEPILIEEEPENSGIEIFSGAVARRRDSFESRQALHKYLRSKPLYKDWKEDILNEYMDHGFQQRPDGSYTLRCLPVDEAATYIKGPYSSLTRALPTIQCPVHIFVGEDSHHLDTHHPDGTMAVYQNVVSRFPHAQLHAVPRGNHFLPQEDPARWAQLIAEIQTGDLQSKAKL